MGCSLGRLSSQHEGLVQYNILWSTAEGKKCVLKSGVYLKSIFVKRVRFQDTRLCCSNRATGAATTEHGHSRSSGGRPSLIPLGLYPCRQRWKQLWKTYWYLSRESIFLALADLLLIFTNYTALLPFQMHMESKAWFWKGDTFSLICPQCQPVGHFTSK